MADPEDCCPICADCLIEPVRLSHCCGAVLCLPCLRRMMEVNSSNCSFCRKRLAAWVRLSSCLVDTELQKRLAVARKRGAAEISQAPERGESHADRTSSEPGELRRYYEGLANALEMQTRVPRLRGEAAALADLLTSHLGLSVADKQQWRSCLATVLSELDEAMAGSAAVSNDDAVEMQRWHELAKDPSAIAERDGDDSVPGALSPVSVEFVGEEGDDFSFVEASAAGRKRAAVSHDAQAASTGRLATAAHVTRSRKMRSTHVDDFYWSVRGGFPASMNSALGKDSFDGGLGRCLGGDMAGSDTRGPASAVTGSTNVVHLDDSNPAVVQVEHEVIILSSDDDNDDDESRTGDRHVFGRSAGDCVASSPQSSASPPTAAATAPMLLVPAMPHRGISLLRATEGDAPSSENDGALRAVVTTSASASHATRDMRADAQSLILADSLTISSDELLRNLSSSAGRRSAIGAPQLDGGNAQAEIRRRDAIPRAQTTLSQWPSTRGAGDVVSPSLLECTVSETASVASAAVVSVSSVSAVSVPAAVDITIPSMVEKPVSHTSPGTFTIQQATPFKFASNVVTPVTNFASPLVSAASRNVDSASQYAATLSNTAETASKVVISALS